ncbi:MAG: flagellar motor switch protein FliG [Nitrospiria bacterium]
MAEKLSGFDKAAILLMKLGEDAASEVMKGLDPKDLRKIGAMISGLSDVPKEDVDLVLREFSEDASKTGGITIEGKDYIQKVLVKALGEEKATHVMDGLTTEEDGGLESLKWMDAKSIANLIRGEHPQTISIILTQLEMSQSSEVLSHFSQEQKANVIVRMATLEDIPPGALKEIGAALKNDMSVTGTASGRKVKGVKLVADILNITDKTSEEAIMTSITENQPELADEIRQLMFVFDDLIQLDNRGLQELLKGVSKEDLSIALRAAKEELKEKFFSNMSERAVQLFKEDMEAKGPVKLSDVEKAQMVILKIAKKLEEEGKIVIGGGGGGGDAMV